MFISVSSTGLPGIVSRVRTRFVYAPSHQGDVSGSCGKQLGLLEDGKVGFLSAGWMSLEPALEEAAVVLS